MQGMVCLDPGTRVPSGRLVVSIGRKQCIRHHTTGGLVEKPPASDL